MSRSVNMCVRVDPEIKEQAEEVLEQLGMNMNGTINMFLHQIVREKRVPLNLNLVYQNNIENQTFEAQNERENGFVGIEARDILNQMKQIISDAEAKS